MNQLHFFDQFLPAHLMKTWRFRIDEIVNENVEVAGIDGEAGGHGAVDFYFDLVCQRRLFVPVT